MEETQRLWGYDPLISPYEFLADGDEPDYGRDEDFTAEELACLTRTFADILSDEGLKAVFYSVNNSDLLVELVNVMLNGCRRATKLTHLRNEFSAPASDGRRSWLDITCIDENGNLFDVEVQRRSTGSTFRRFVSYACKTYELGLQFENKEEERERKREEAGDKGGEPKYYRLKPTYVIVILESKPNTEEGVTYGQRLYSHYTMKEIRTNEVAPSTINVIFASLAFFDKSAEECTTDLDRWCYMFRHLGELTDAPEGFRDKVMRRLMSAARIANFNKKQKKLYIKVAMDREYTKELIYESWVKGEKKGIRDTAKRALENGASPEFVSKITGMNLESVLALQ